MNPTADTKAGELAMEVPTPTRVFEKTGINYCCGVRSPAEAFASAGVDFKNVQMELAANAGDEVPNFQTTTLENLINHIVIKHHSFTRLAIARLNALLDKVCMAHGENHSELIEIYVLFRELGADLETHMAKEERVLFPYLIGMEAAAKQQLPLFRAPFQTVADPVRMMMLEHDRAVEFLKKIRHLTSNYVAPADGCMSYQTLYAALETLDKDLIQHIHLENNVLFPRAIEMEPIAEATSVN